MVKVSVITINYNDVKGLNKTIDSIISQRFTNYEYIIIDGGSTDGSVELIRQNLDKISYWVSESDRGIYHAMNKGILRASGEYCYFLNSGDSLVNKKVLAKVFETDTDSDIIFGNLIVCDKNGNEIAKRFGKNKITFLDIYSNNLKHQASFIKRSLFDIYDLYNEDLKIIADWEFFIKSLGLGSATTKYINVDIAYFNNNGISNNAGTIYLNERKKILEELLPLRIREDYLNFSVISSYIRINNYKFSRLIFRILNRGIKLYEGLFR